MLAQEFMCMFTRLIGRPRFWFWLLLCAPITWPNVWAGAATEPRVVVTIKPLHSLASAVMAGVATPKLLIDGGTSPHSVTLRPSDALALNQADVIFWVGPALERFLVRTLQGLKPGAGLALMEQPGINVLPTRAGGLWGRDAQGEEHDHHHDHDHGSLDPHIWLDPQNAITMVEIMAVTLERLDPAHAGRYAQNRELTVRTLQALDQELTATLEAVKTHPFIVFHDGFHYLEARYQLTALGAVTNNPELAPGAHRLRALRERVKSGAARCVFSEPQFRSAAVATIVEGTGAKTGILDSLGGTIPPGAAAYPQMMRQLGAELRNCLIQ